MIQLPDNANALIKQNQYPEIITYIRGLLESMQGDEASWDKRDGDIYEASFNELFGGDQFVVETEDDLLKVEGVGGFATDTLYPGIYRNLKEHDYAVFDLCMKLSYDDNALVICMLCNNNGGGPSFFVPYTMCPDKLEKSIDASETF